jgi:hypothetical protein
MQGKLFSFYYFLYPWTSNTSTTEDFGHPSPIGHTTRPLAAQLVEYNAGFVQNVTCFDALRTAKMFMFNSSANKTYSPLESQRVMKKCNLCGFIYTEVLWALKGGR